MTVGLHGLMEASKRRAEEIAALVSVKEVSSNLVNRVSVILAISSMEGLAYQLKDSIAEISNKQRWTRKSIAKRKQTGRTLADEFPYLLAGADTRTIIDDDGSLKDWPAKHRSLPHILFSLRYAAFFFDVPLHPNQITDWQHVKPTFGVRDRVIHPKKESDLSVSEAERNNALKAFMWYRRCLLEIESAAD